MFRNRLKTILFAFTIVVTLSIMVVAQAFTNYEEDLEKRLQSKKFISPTEFYAAATRFSKDTYLFKDRLFELLKKQNFRQRQVDQRLLPGDFSWGVQKECETKLGTLSINYTQCFSFVNKSEGADKAESNQYWILMDESLLVLEVFKGNPTQPVAQAEMEPELLAQYLNTDPIMQEEVSISEIPTYCPNAIMAIEDAKFLEHSGFSVTGTLRGLVMPLLRGKRPQGGSTITQQLVKNYFLTNERSAKRKLEELVLSVLIEKKLTKDQILETYMNIIYMGQNGPFQLIGFGAASKYYFQRKISDIGLAECALLAAVLNGPGVYNPFTKVEKTLVRRNLVLTKMKDLKLISEHEFDEAKKVPLPAKKPNLASETAPYYIDAVRKQMKELNIPLEGAKIYTGLDLSLQQQAQEALKNHLEKLEKDNKRISEIKSKGSLLEGVVMAVDNRSGIISVAVGGRNFRMTQFNRTVDGHRQVGSIFKPLVYLTALTKKDKSGNYFNPLSQIPDEKFEIKYQKQKWTPENYTKNFFGLVPFYFALKNSLNAATANLGLEVGLDEIIQTARSFGVRSELKNFPSLTLGAFEMYPVEVLQIYSTLANVGNENKVSFISKVKNTLGQIVFEHKAEFKNVFEPVPISSLLSIMKQTPKTGTAKLIAQSGYDYPVAGKTGTTSDFKDSWFAGITPFMTSIVWVGYDQNLVTGLTGGSGAVPVWLQFMKTASEKFSKKDFAFPEDKIKRVNIDSSVLEKLKVNLELEKDLAPFELIFDKDKIPSGL